MIGWRILLWAVLVLTALVFLYLVRGILPPFIIAFVIASLLDPSIRRLRLRGLKRIYAVSLVFVVFFAALIGIGLIIGPRIATQVSELATQIDDLTRTLARSNERDNYFLRWNPVVQAQRAEQPNRIDNLLEPHKGTLERFGLPATQREIYQRYIEPRRGEIAQTVRAGFDAFLGVLKNLPAQILHIVLIPILVFMLLMDMEDFKRRSPRWIPPAIRGSTLRLFEDIGDVFMRYLRGITTVVILFTVAVTILFLVLRVPYAALIGLAFGALYLIPYIGNIISCVVLFSLVAFSGVTGFGVDNPWIYAVICTGLFLLVGFVFDHLIYPQMVGSSVGLNGVVSLFVILCGGALFGLPGMILAFPLAGAVKVMLERLLRVTSTTGEQLNLPPVPLRHRANMG
jgi:predicted PurR-regulated permease PerM